MSDPELHTKHLAQRLSKLGVNVRIQQDGLSSIGELALGPEPFEAFGRRITLRKARFYTLGHNRLKFFDPRILFDLPALDTAGCETAADLERELRGLWEVRRHDLLAARKELERIGADIGAAAHGTRLLLAVTGESGPPAVVLSARELLIPSVGPLRDHSLSNPAERRFQLVGGQQHASELELSVTQAVERLGLRQERRARAASRRETAPALVKGPGRVLVLDGDLQALAEAETLLGLCGFEVEILHDPLRALGAFAQRSFDAVIVAARMPRIDGLEFTARLREVPGIEELPVVILDDRPNPNNQRAAQTLRAAAYLARPPRWRELGEWLCGRLEEQSRRRFGRFAARLSAEASGAEATQRDLIHTVSRGGFGLRSRRGLMPHALETYRVLLPLPLKPVRVQGEVVHCDEHPGEAALQAGVRIHRFLDRGEARWVRMIESLARHDAAV